MRKYRLVLKSAGPRVVSHVTSTVKNSILTPVLALLDYSRTAWSGSHPTFVSKGRVSQPLNFLSFFEAISAVFCGPPQLVNFTIFTHILNILNYFHIFNFSLSKWALSKFQISYTFLNFGRSVLVLSTWY
jgi:hypothetical protein